MILLFPLACSRGKAVQQVSRSVDLGPVSGDNSLPLPSTPPTTSVPPPVVTPPPVVAPFFYSLDGFAGLPGALEGQINLLIDFPPVVSNYAVVEILRQKGLTAPDCNSGTLVLRESTNFVSRVLVDNTGSTSGELFSYRACVYSTLGEVNAASILFGVPAKHIAATPPPVVANPLNQNTCVWSPKPYRREQTTPGVFDPSPSLCAAGAYLAGAEYWAYTGGPDGQMKNFCCAPAANSVTFAQTGCAWTQYLNGINGRATSSICQGGRYVAGMDYYADASIAGDNQGKVAAYCCPATVTVSALPVKQEICAWSTEFAHTASNSGVGMKKCAADEYIAGISYRAGSSGGYTQPSSEAGKMKIYCCKP